MTRRRRPAKRARQKQKKAIWLKLRPRGTTSALLLVAAVAAVAIALVVAPRLLVGGEKTKEVGEAAVATSPQRMGALDVSSPSVDLGHVALGQWANYTFRLRNAGEAPLVVTVEEGSIAAVEGC